MTQGKHKLVLRFLFRKDIALIFIMLLLCTNSYTYSGGISKKNISLSPTSVFYGKSVQKTNFVLTPIEVILTRITRDNHRASIAAKVEMKKPSVLINNNGVLSEEKMAAYLLLHNPGLSNDKAKQIVDYYVEEAKHEGINHDVAFSQMCLETGYLKYGGDVDPEQNNFCGLGVVGGGVKGMSFKDVRSGVRAHIQHLKAYANNDELKFELIDERFHYVKRGCAPHVNDLTGKWATDKNYGNKISNILSRLNEFKM